MEESLRTMTDKNSRSETERISLKEKLFKVREEAKLKHLELTSKIESIAHENEVLDQSNKKLIRALDRQALEEKKLVQHDIYKQEKEELRIKFYASEQENESLKAHLRTITKDNL